MEIDDNADLEINYEPGSTEIEVIAGDETETVGPDEARKLAAYIEANHVPEMAREESDLAAFVADLEVTADRAERAQYEQ